MAKITRWKGGIKEGNRREVDMTDSYFNTAFSLKRLDQQTPKDLEWKVEIEEEKHRLRTSRKEGVAFTVKEDIEDALHVNDYFVDQIGGGLKYLDPGDAMLRRSLITLGTSDINKITIGNPEASMDLIMDTERKLRIIEVVSDPVWEAIVIPQDTSIVTADWAFDFTSINSNVFTGQRLLMEGTGVPYRYSLAAPSGKIWYENMSQYEFDEVPEAWVGNTIHSSGITELKYPDPFFLDLGEELKVRIQTKVPTLRHGTIIPGAITTPPGGFLQSTQAETRDVKVYEIAPESIVIKSDLGRSEYALASMHDYTIADSLHLKDCQVLTMDDGITLLFNT